MPRFSRQVSRTTSDYDGVERSPRQSNQSKNVQFGDDSPVVRQRSGLADASVAVRSPLRNNSDTNTATTSQRTTARLAKVVRKVGKMSKTVSGLNDDPNEKRKRLENLREDKMKNSTLVRLSLANSKRLQFYVPIFLLLMSLVVCMRHQCIGTWCEGRIDWSFLEHSLDYLILFAVALFILHAMMIRHRQDLFEFESQIWKYRDHAIVCGAGHTALKFAALMHRRGYLVIVIAKHEDRRLLQSESDLRTIRFLPIADYSDKRVLARAGVKNAALLFIATGDDSNSLSLAYLVSSMLEDYPRAKKLQAWVHISEMKTAGVGDMLSRAGNDSLTVDPIEYHLAAARLCLEYHPPWGNLVGPPLAGEPPVHVVVIGLGFMGRALINQLIKIGHFADEAKLRITVVCCTPDDILAYKMFLALYPHLHTIAEIENIENPPELISYEVWRSVISKQGPIQAFYIADVTDELRVVHVGLGLRRLPLNNKPRIVACLDSPNVVIHRELFRAFSDDFDVYSVRDKVLIDELVDQRLDALALVVHETYRQDYGGPSWGKLSFQEKANNRYAADHFSVRKGILIHTAGYPEIVSNIGKISQMLENRSGAYSNLLESLAKVEHRRWVATKLLDGWTPGYGDKNTLKKEHPSLVPFDLLPESEKVKCRKSILAFPQQLRAARDIALASSSLWNDKLQILGFGWLFAAIHLGCFSLVILLSLLQILFLLDIVVR